LGGTKRRTLYEEYRAWVVNGRKATRSMSLAQQQQQAMAAARRGQTGATPGGPSTQKQQSPPKRAQQRNAATIASGAFKKKTRAMIESEQRAQKMMAKKKQRAAAPQMKLQQPQRPQNVPKPVVQPKMPPKKGPTAAQALKRPVQSAQQKPQRQNVQPQRQPQSARRQQKAKAMPKLKKGKGKKKAKAVMIPASQWAGPEPKKAPPPKPTGPSILAAASAKRQNAKKNAPQRAQNQSMAQRAQRPTSATPTAKGQWAASSAKPGGVARTMANKLKAEKKAKKRNRKRAGKLLGAQGAAAVVGKKAKNAKGKQKMQAKARPRVVPKGPAHFPDLVTHPPQSGSAQPQSGNGVRQMSSGRGTGKPKQWVAPSGPKKKIGSLKVVQTAPVKAKAAPKKQKAIPINNWDRIKGKNDVRVLKAQGQAGGAMDVNELRGLMSSIMAEDASKKKKKKKRKRKKDADRNALFKSIEEKEQELAKAKAEKAPRVLKVTPMGQMPTFNKTKIWGKAAPPPPAIVAVKKVTVTKAVSPPTEQKSLEVIEPSAEQTEMALRSLGITSTVQTKQKRKRQARRDDLFKPLTESPVVNAQSAQSPPLTATAQSVEELEKEQRIRQLEQELASLKSAEQNESPNSSKKQQAVPAKPKAKKPQKQQKIKEKKPAKVEKKAQQPQQQPQSSSYFTMVLDAKSELQGAFVRMSSLGNGERVGEFLVFLFSCLYPIFERDFETEMSVGCERLSRRYRQHVFQTLYDQFLVKSPEVVVSVPNEKRLRLQHSAYQIREGENVVSWRFMMALPGVSENAATQLSGLFDMMLAMADEEEVDLTMLKPWVEQMDFSFAEVYPLLLYLWLILDVDLPAPPYPFIKPKVRRQVQQQVPQQVKRPQMSARRMKKKKQAKAKPVVLFKMGGM